jgi:putative ABC transport system permease protein
MHLIHLRQLHGWLVRLFGIFTRQQREQEFAEELESHLAFHIEDNLRAGLSPEEARRQALVKLGGVTQTQELHREQRGLPMLETLLQDLRYGARMLVKQPGFTLIAMLTLALGIGANTAIFSVINAVLLRALPYHDAARIVAIEELDAKGGRRQVTAPNFLDWRAQNTVFAHLAAIRTLPANLTQGDQAERIDTAIASANFFEVFGALPQAGRLFLPGDEAAGHAPVVVLSYGLWQRRFGGAAEALGQALTLDGRNYTIIGVAPQGFQYPDKTEAWRPPLRLAPEASETADPMQNRGSGYLKAVAKLKPGVTLQQAQVEMETITARLRQQFPESNNTRFNRVVSLQRFLVGDTSRLLWLLLGAAACVLLIACANVASLLLARATVRRRELAVRAALGASRGRVLRQLLTESLLLALGGGLLGLLLAWWGVDVLTRMLPADFPRRAEIALDLPVLGFALLASVLTAFVFGLAPAWQAAQVELQEALKESARGNAGARRNRLRAALVVAEVALSLVLLVGAGLLLRGFLRLQAVDAGFDAGGVLTLRLAPSGPNFREDPQYVAYYRKVAERLSALPGVEAVGAINTLPLGGGPTSGFRVEGRPELTRDKWPLANYRNVTPDYFRALHIPIKQGRPFSERDSNASPLVVLINETAAAREFAGENPVGKRITFGGRNPQGQPVWWEVVGVVGDVRSIELKDKAEPEVFTCAAQDAFGGMSFVVRTSVDPASLSGAARQTIGEIDPAQPVTDLRTMETIKRAAVSQPRFNLTLLGVFGGLALLLSAAGVYGVTSYAVSQRTHEIGIRKAIGAQTSDVLRLVIGQGIKLIAIGVAIGLAASFAAAQVIKSLLFGVSATDPLTFVGVPLLLTFVALLACYLPARRATKVDPMIALRSE